MAREFKEGAFNVILTAGLKDVESEIKAYSSTGLLSEKTFTWGDVDYNFSTDSGNPTITFGPVVLEGFENGDEVTHIEIWASAGSVLWEDDTLSITFTSSGNLTVSGTFTLGGNLIDKGKAAILQEGLKNLSGNLTLLGTSVPAAKTFSFPPNSNLGAISQTSQVDFDVDDGTVVTGVKVEVDFASPIGLVELGTVTLSEDLSFDAPTTCTVSDVKIELSND